MSGTMSWGPNQAIPDLNDPAAAQYGFGGGPQDPYLQMLLRRRLMAQALEQQDAPQRMTHWAQVLGSIANKGVGAWKEAKTNQDILDYSKRQREEGDALVRSILEKYLPNGIGGAGDGSAPVPHAATSSGPAPTSGGASYGGINVPAEFAPHIDAAAKAYGVPAPLLAWVGNQESGFRGRPGMTDTRDNQTPQGPWQFKPQTGAQYGLSPEDLNDPAKSTMAAGAYLADLYKQHGNWADAIGKGYGTFSPRPGETSDALRQRFIEFSKQFANPSTGVGTPIEAAYAPTPVGGPPQPGISPVASSPATPGAVPGQAPGQPPMTQAQRLMMTAAALQMRGGSDPRMAAIASGLKSMAGAFPDGKPITVAPGGTVYNPVTRQVEFTAPQAPDRELVKIDLPGGGYRMVPRSEASNLTGAPAVSPIPGLMPDDVRKQQEELARARAQNTVINTGDKKLQTMAAEDFGKAQDAATDAAKRAILYNRLDAAISRFPPGKDFDVRLWAGQIANVFGVKSENLSEGEMGKLIASRLAIQAAPKGQGQVSNYERSLFAGALPQMTTTLDGTRKAVQIMRDLDAMDIGVAKIYRDNARKNGGIPDPISVAEEIAAFSASRAGAIQDQLAPYSGQEQATSAPTLSPGEVRKGYRFKGGDPSDKNSWERVTQ